MESNLGAIRSPGVINKTRYVPAEGKRDPCLLLCIWLVGFLYFRNLLNAEVKNIFVPLIYCPVMDRPLFLMSNVSPYDVLALLME